MANDGIKTTYASILFLINTNLRPSTYLPFSKITSLKMITAKGSILAGQIHLFANGGIGVSRKLPTGSEIFPGPGFSVRFFWRTLKHHDNHKNKANRY